MLLIAADYMYYVRASLLVNHVASTLRKKNIIFKILSIGIVISGGRNIILACKVLRKPSRIQIQWLLLLVALWRNFACDNFDS